MIDPKTSDIVNGVFELLGAICVWANVGSYAKDRAVKGVFWPATAFYSVWGLWNIVYYPALGQWFSFWGGVAIVSGNLFWIAWVLWDKYNSKEPARRQITPTLIVPHLTSVEPMDQPGEIFRFRRRVA